jgi:hypothetical protein
MASAGILDSEPHPRTHSEGGPYSLHTTRALCPFRVGIAPACEMACDKTALAAVFSLYLHSDKQDNNGMEKKPNPHAQALGSLGGKARARNLSEAEVAQIASKGGKARAAKLSPAERSRIAKLAVAAREHKRKGGK